MKKTLLLTSMLLALAVSVALAGGVNINWGTVCYSQTPVNATTFLCNTNGAAGSRQITVSFRLDAPLPDMVGLEYRIEGQSDLPALPDYWKLGLAPSTDCRAGRASFLNNFVPVEDVCLDWTGGSAFDAKEWAWETNRVHIQHGVAIADVAPFAPEPDVEYYGGGISLLNNKVVGTGACTGCSAGMLFGLYSLTAAGKSGTRLDFFEALPGGNQCLSWNNTIQPCAAPVPARNTTWGQVKSLYR